MEKIMGKCTILGLEVADRFMTKTEDGYWVDKQLYAEATIAFKTSLLTKADLERYALLRRRFNQALQLTARLLRKSAESSKKEHIEEEIDAYLWWETEKCMEVYGFYPACMDLFHQTTLLEAYNSEFGVIDTLEVVPEENKNNGSSTALITSCIMADKKYSGWVHI
jgi:hypothetical protein